MTRAEGRISGMQVAMLLLLLACPVVAFQRAVRFEETRRVSFPSSSFITSRPSYRSMGPLFSKDNANSSDDDGMEEINVEQERQRLESLLMGTSTDTEKKDTDHQSLLDLPFEEWKNVAQRDVPLLTSIGRERLEYEITLLESLATSDDAIPELWNLWYNQRGPEAAKELMVTESLVAQGQPEGWQKAETLLRELIAKEGVHYVEPVNRLATLLFLQSRFDESLVLCKLVLQLKPWHFGALSGIVMVYQGLQLNDEMLAAAKERMPPLPKKGDEEQEAQLFRKGQTRQQWVDRMLDTARARLLREEMDLEEAFSKLENINANATDATSSDRNSNPQIDDRNEDDAWQ